VHSLWIKAEILPRGRARGGGTVDELHGAHLTGQGLGRKGAARPLSQRGFVPTLRAVRIPSVLVDPSEQERRPTTVRASVPGAQREQRFLGEITPPHVAGGVREGAQIL